MRRWICIDTAFKNFTVGKVYVTDDNGKGIINDNEKVDQEVPWNFSKTKFVEIFVKNDFTKSDLQEGDIIVCRNSFRLVYFNKKFIDGNSVSTEITKYEDNLLRRTFPNKTPGFDVMQVYRNNELIFERIEKKERQIELEKLKENIKELEKRIEEMEKENL